MSVIRKRMNPIGAAALFLGVAALAAAAVAQPKPDITVAADGSGDFATIQGALDSIPRSNTARVVIFVRDGVYREKIRIDQNRVTLRGQSRERTRIEFEAPRSEFDRRMDGIGPAVLNVFGEDDIVENLSIVNTQPTTNHAFTICGQPLRFILADCDALSSGGDTVSLWNTVHGMYYHSGCNFRGAVDFVCPRGWCHIDNSKFYGVNQTATLWMDGHMDLDMKFVLRNCTFDGVQDFQLGRNGYPAQFYLLDCVFSAHMGDRPIGLAGRPKPTEDPATYNRKYFFDCRREGGADLPWYANNLDQAPGAPKPEQITPAWTFDGKWDPVSRDAPAVQAVWRDGDKLTVVFSEDVSVAGRPRVQLAGGGAAAYLGGGGTQRLMFEGGDPSAAPERLDLNGGTILGCVATLAARYVSAEALPAVSEHKPLTFLVVGDSTVADYAASHPSQGWGRFLGLYLDKRVTIQNRAVGGRSSKSFLGEGLWEKARTGVKPDYVLIQFGHNDNPGKGPERQTDPAPGGDYRANLRRIIAETRAMGAEPILVSSPPRRNFDPGGAIANDANAPYAEAALAVAGEEKCAAVDLHTLMRQYFERLGEATSNWIQPVGDRSHFTPAGARVVAAIVAGELLRQRPELAPYLDRDAIIAVSPAY